MFLVPNLVRVMNRQYRPKKLLATVFSVSFATLAGAQSLKLSDLPLNIQSDVPSNIVVTLDDSGSMAWGYLPDSISGDDARNYFRSSSYNRIYYDPEVDYAPPRDSLGASQGDADFNAAIRGYFYAPGNQYKVDLATSFRPVYSHSSTGSITWLGNNDAAHYYVFDSSLASCNGNVNDEDCYQKIDITDAGNYPGGVNKQGRTQAEEQTNFGNWYQYYAIRADASKSAVQRAFVPNNVDDTVRVGRQTLNANQAIQSGTAAQNYNYIAAFDTAERAAFYDWVASVRTQSRTPLRAAVYRAGEYFKTDNAYYTDPSTNSGDLVGCRVNSHILVTDGFYNGSFITPAGFTRDQTAVTLPDGKGYNPATSPIYSNSLDSQSIADLAFHYWATDLRPGIGAGYANNITPFESKDPAADPDDYWDPRNDPANWQHMNSFAVSFGAQGTLNKDDATFKSLLGGLLAWPKTSTNNATTIDDLWHGSINGRGDFFNAANPTELVQALEDITDRLAERTGNVAKVGATSGRISSGASIYIAGFSLDSWSGDLRSFSVSDGSEVDDPAATGCNSKPLGTLCSSTPDWSAADRNDETDSHVDPANRVILSYDPAVVGDAGNGDMGILFNWSALNASQQALLDQGDGLGEERVNYIRGDDSNELKQGGPFRSRLENSGGQVTRVGPIVHSVPVYVGPAGDDLPFRFPDDLEAKPYAIGSRDELVYVGGGDGMLHAYDASSGGNGGQEVWAYIPNGIMDSLHELTAPAFGAGAFVDGQLDVQDAYVNGNWRTLLAGGLRSGAQGYFLLDVTRPPSGATIDPSENVRWEFTDDDDADLGYTYAQPVIVKSNYNGGEWVVLLASGYNSTEADGNVGTGEAFLYVLSAEDGSLIAKIGTGEGDLANPNGLSSPVAVSDTDIQHFAEKADTGTDPDVWTTDYAYAGDLLGNMWKFDLSSTSPADWEAYLLYDTGSTKPITAKPALGSFPARGSDPDNQEYRFVYFGTGQYIDPSDVSTTSGQTMYAVIDDDTCTSKHSACVSQTDIVTQTISSAGVLSNNPIDVNNDKGCSINLQTGGSSERVISQPLVVAGTVLFSSVRPSGDVCNAGLSGALFAVNRFTCGSTSVQILDTNNDGEIDDTDKSNGLVVSRKLSSASAPKLFQGPKGDAAIITPEGVEQLQAGDRKGRVRWRRLK